MATEPDQTSIIITIDGPAGTGKSTLARQLAARLSLDFLDTGAMYRAATAIVIEHGVDHDDHDAVLAAVVPADIHFDWRTDPPAVMRRVGDGYVPMGDRLRDADVTALVSPIAAIGALRRHLVRKQRLIAAQHPRLVTEGRDQGSVAFPEAPAKFYLDARPEVRAQRRAEQLIDQGRPAPDPAALLDAILQRDLRDSTRADGPLVRPPDARLIDTSDLTVEQVLEDLAAHSIAMIRRVRPGWSPRSDGGDHP